MKKLLKSFNIVAGISFLIIVGFCIWNLNETPSTVLPTKENVVSSDSIGTSIDVDFTNLTLKVQKARETKYHFVTKMPDTEYVKDNVGDYFIIDLKDTVTRKIILFPKGEYTFNSNEWAITSALDEVNYTIFSIVKGSKCKLFIEGQADYAGDKTFSRKFEKGFIFNKIIYYPKLFSNDRFISYENKPDTANLDTPLNNSNLPLLRSNFLKLKIGQYRNIPPIILLEGGVTHHVGPEYRNGKIILFVDAKQKKFAR